MIFQNIWEGAKKAVLGVRELSEAECPGIAS